MWYLSLVIKAECLSFTSRLNLAKYSNPMGFLIVVIIIIFFFFFLSNFVIKYEKDDIVIKLN